MDDYLSKPVQAEALEAALQQWVHPHLVPGEPPVSPANVDHQGETDIQATSSVSDEGFA